MHHYYCQYLPTQILFSDFSFTKNPNNAPLLLPIQKTLTMLVRLVKVICNIPREYYLKINIKINNCINSHLDKNPNAG